MAGSEAGYNTFYASWHEAMSGLTLEQYGRVAKALNDYCFFGEETELTGVEKVIFIMAKPGIDAAKRQEASNE